MVGVSIILFEVGSTDQTLSFMRTDVQLVLTYWLILAAVTDLFVVVQGRPGCQGNKKRQKQAK
jgi:hypothetical protein